MSVAKEEMGVPTAPTLVPRAMPAQSFEKWLIRIALGTLLIIWLLTSEVTNAPQASKTVLKKSEMAGI